ncbi:GWxTD domain-containing protein [Bacteroidota bacterium]|nr:GWxTD domain-containing protein [Bacteroidota bacterium]
MKKISLLILVFFSFFGYSSNIESFLQYSIFYTDKGEPYLETYLTINSKSIKLKDNGDNTFQGKLSINLLVESNDSIVYNDKYFLSSPIQDSNNKSILFIDQQRIKLVDGNYKLVLNIKDVNSDLDKLIVEDFTIEIFENNFLSDIQFVDKYNVSSQTSILSKSGFDLYPYKSNFFDDLQENLTFYIEVYNSYQLENNRFLFNTFIKGYQDEIIYNDFYSSNRMKAEQVVPHLQTYNISGLPKGNYSLVCEIRDIKNNLIDKKTKFFQRNNEKINIQSQNQLNEDFVRIENKDTLSKYLDYLYPISTPNESRFARNFINKNDIDLMNNFFIDFWTNRDQDKPYRAWMKYHNEVKKVNAEFTNIKILGYLTDRGRVYLQYGAPNSRHKSENNSSTYPYEIWHYYKLENQINKKFVFINDDFATNEYKLRYSNVDGEVSNSEWRDKIEIENNPNFGDDFNRIYNNPR